MKPEKLYLGIVLVAFISLTVVFLTFPRSTYSELEKRELAKRPEFSIEKLTSNQYTSEISSWFSDSEPYRDKLMAASMSVRDAIRMNFGSDEEAVSFHAADSDSDADADAGPLPGATPGEMEEYKNNINADGVAKIANKGIIITGRVPNVRALMAYGGGAKGGVSFANALNDYKTAMPNLNVYAMVIPLASEFYLPDKARKNSNPQLPTIKNIYANLKGVRGINAYTALANHVEEPIYLRTDHHWAPLGAFYAAKEFARVAGVPFNDLNSYDKHIIKNYVGTMYGYSKDISVKNSPEDFVYYTPKGLDYKTTYRVYTTNKNYHVTREGKPQEGPYFYKYKDGSSAAYSTFMGGDQKLTKVVTGTKNGRRLLVIKDSYGNAVPGYLFYSFEEVHVVDFRYFTRNIKKYIEENKITDLVACVNIFNAYSSSVAQKIKNMLTRHDSSEMRSESESTPAPTDKDKAIAGKENNSAAEHAKADTKTEAKPESKAEAKPATQPTPATKTAIPDSLSH